MEHDAGPGGREAVSARPGKTGTFLGLPYDWRRPTRARLKASAWNPHDPRILTPKAFGWGLSINFWALCCRLGLARRGERAGAPGRCGRR